MPDWARGCVLFEHGAWYQAYWKKMAFYRWHQWRLKKLAIEHHLIVNTEAEAKLAGKFGVRAKQISHNVYCSEKVFRPEPLEKKFAALYIAKSERFKRHALAKNIQNLAILRSSGPPLEQFCPEVSHATTNAEVLEKPEVARFINQSHCTLALSAEEGGMFASFESLLCGVPVVSTPSVGGRDLFYNQFNSIIAQPDPEKVREAVEKIVTDGVDCAKIRADAVSRLEALRIEYSAYLSDAATGGTVSSSIFHQRMTDLNLDDLFCDASAAMIPTKIVDLLV